MIQPIIFRKYNDELFMMIPPLADNIKPYYIISNYGEVFNIYTGDMIIPHENENRYLQVSLMTETGRAFRKVHRLVMMCFFYFYGCEQYQVNHRNGNKKINAYWNLEWSTPKENVSHAISTGLRGPFLGEYNPMAIIDSDIAREIGMAIINGIPDRDIANMYCNGNLEIVRNIAYGRTWNHIFNDNEKALISLSRRGNIISDEDRHSLCKFYEANSKDYSGYGSTTRLVKDSLISIGLDPNDIRIFRVAKRLFYRYESDEITNLYNY